MFARICCSLALFSVYLHAEKAKQSLFATSALTQTSHATTPLPTAPAQTTPPAQPIIPNELQPQTAQTAATLPQQQEEGPVINFNNVSITEFLRFVSHLTGKNFVFDPDELQFPVTIVSETPASIHDIMAALLQNLRIHDFLLIEENNNFVIYKNPKVRAPATLLTQEDVKEIDIATQVFQVANTSATRIAAIVRVMSSPQAIVEVMDDTSRVVVTDFVPNINKISEIIHKLDAPNSGLEIGQYVALNSSPAALIQTAERILTPLAAGKPLILVPYIPSNSIFILSSPFVVEKGLSILQSLDLGEGATRVLNLDQMKYNEHLTEQAQEKQAKEALHAPVHMPSTQEIEQLTEDELRHILKQKGYSDAQLNGLTRDQLSKLLQEKGVTETERKQIEARRKQLFENQLPLGQVEGTQFLFQKLQYRKSTDVAHALRAISDSLATTGASSSTPGAPPVNMQSDLITTLNSIQPLEANNALVITGTYASIQKVKELISQIDIPVRQVFIEALILDTTIQNSLHYGVQWAGKVERHNFTAQGGLISPNSTGFLNAFNAINMPASSTELLVPAQLQPGFTAGSIGRKVKYNGNGFNTTGELISAIRHDDDTHIVLNPKIVTEHNVPAEIFVGQQIPIKGQSIVNATSSTSSSIVATNYNLQETGVLLKVTPLISSSNTVTLIIEQRISSANSAQVNAQGTAGAPPATVNEIRALTRIHIPSDYFLIMSGLIQVNNELVQDMIPCLGAIPALGFAFSQKTNTNSQRNVILFMKPQIIDSTTDIEKITKREERIYKEKDTFSKQMHRNIVDVLEVLNLDS